MSNFKLPIKKVKSTSSPNCDGCIFNAKVSQYYGIEDQLCTLIQQNTPIDPSDYCDGSSIFVANENEVEESNQSTLLQDTYFSGIKFPEIE